MVDLGLHQHAEACPKCGGQSKWLYRFSAVVAGPDQRRAGEYELVRRTCSSCGAEWTSVEAEIKAI